MHAGRDARIYAPRYIRDRIFASCSSDTREKMRNVLSSYLRPSHKTIGRIAMTRSCKSATLLLLVAMAALVSGQHDCSVPCNDRKLCTTDTCDPISGCSFTPVTCPKPNQRCDAYDGRCKSPFYKACDFLGLRRNTCNRTTTFVGFTNQTKIPTEIGLLTELSWLGLRDNRMVGTIPSQIGNMHKLHTLNLHGNSLKGTVPSALSKLTRLISLTLYGNRLTGTIPPELCSPNRTIEIDCGEISCSCCLDSNGAACL